MSSRKAFARHYTNEKQDAVERVLVLRLQAMAWRHVALIATADPVRGAQLSKWLFFQTVPFTNGPAIETFIKETETEAEAAGRKSGVFGPSVSRADRGGPSNV